MSEAKKKKQRLDNGKGDDVVASFTSLSTDILANIFGHLPLKELCVYVVYVKRQSMPSKKRQCLLNPISIDASELIVLRCTMP